MLDIAWDLGIVVQNNPIRKPVERQYQHSHYMIVADRFQDIANAFI